jgi:lipid-binding SYLF domain-containing protein
MRPIQHLFLSLTAIALVGPAAAQDQDELEDARETVNDALEVVQEMQSDPEVAQMLQTAKGVFIVPAFGQAALIAGGSGGEGVVLVRQEGSNEWSPPAFYNMGGISLGAEAGIEGGSIAIMLMSDESVRPFIEDENNFTLDADAGLTVLDWSAKAQGSTLDGDAIVWSDTEGLFGGASIAITGIIQDSEENAAFYGPDATVSQILEGAVQTREEEAQELSGILVVRVVD